jgi:spoIIIJ-associated protein
LRDGHAPADFAGSAAHAKRKLSVQSCRLSQLPVFSEFVMVDPPGDAIRLRAMTTVETATKILDTMLGHLGLAATIEVQETDDGPCLQIRSTDSQTIIGRDGDRLDDLQYLVNRILRRQFPKAERIKVDCEHFRTIREDQMAREIRDVAARVKETGNSHTLRPLNAYYRRLVHNLLVDDPDIETHSPEGDQRLKRITISVKSASKP